MALTIFHTQDKDLQLLQNQWSSVINPLLASPICLGRLMQNVPLVTGTNAVNHLLGRKLQGYIVVSNSAPVTFYDTQMTNPQPQLTVNIVASGPTTVSLWVF